MRKWAPLGLGAAVLAAVAFYGVERYFEDRSLEVGVWEYFVRDPDPATAKAKMADTTAAGFEGAITNSFWAPGQREPSATEVTELRNAAEAARSAGVRPLLIVQHVGSRTTPRTPRLRAEFAAYAASLARQIPDFRNFIVANEPNLNRFWLPQFGPNGENVAARDYLALLTETYDALKAVSKEIRVVGGALAPRGGDDPDAPRHTHSPTQFIRDMGSYYRQSGRKQPVMDAFAHHPYLERSEVPPDFAHPRSTTISLADYGKLVDLLGEAFDGTAQKGSDIPILYTEFGVQTRDPEEQAERVHEHRLPGREGRRLRGDAGSLLPGSRRACVQPSHGRRHLYLPRLGRAGPARMAIRPLLRRPHSEDEPGRLGRSRVRLVPHPAGHDGFWPAITRRQSPPSSSLGPSDLGSSECGLWLGARDPESRRHYWTEHE